MPLLIITEIEIAYFGSEIKCFFGITTQNYKKYFSPNSFLIKNEKVFFELHLGRRESASIFQTSPILFEQPFFVYTLLFLFKIWRIIYNFCQNKSLALNLMIILQINNKICANYWRNQNEIKFKKTNS